MDEHWCLVGGLEHVLFFHFIYGMSSFPLTNICFKMGRTTKQLLFFRINNCFSFQEQSRIVNAEAMANPHFDTSESLNHHQSPSKIP